MAERGRHSKGIYTFYCRVLATTPGGKNTGFAAVIGF